MRNYNLDHKHSGEVITSSSGGILTVGQLRDAIAEYPDDASIHFGTDSRGDSLRFGGFKSRGPKALSIDLE